MAAPRGYTGLGSLPLLAWAVWLLTSCSALPEQRAGREAARTDSLILHQDARKLRDRLASAIPSLLENQGITGLSLALVRGEEILWTEGFGYADSRRGTPAAADTIFRAGSLAKPLTALAVMQLEERGLIDIDQPLKAYLPQFAIRTRFDTTAEPITVRSILCHHSGLPTDLNKGMWSNASFLEVASKLSEEYTAFPPNLVFSYSNVGYSLLGHLIQEASGETYPGYMQKHIFQPIGMQRTGMGLRPELAPHLSKGYRYGRDAEQLPIRDLPAYGLYTTAMDLARFMQMIFAKGEANGEKILLQGTLEEMVEPQNTQVALDLNIITGLGWFIEKESPFVDTYEVRHGGTTLLFSSELIMLPEKSLGVAVLANSRGSRPAVSLLAREILRLAAESNLSDEPTNLLSIDAFDGVSDEPEPGRLGGNYATDLGLISIRPKDAKVCACTLEKTFDLIPYPNGWYGIRADSVDSFPPSYKALGEIRFQTRIIDGKEVIVAERDNETVVLGEKVPPAPVPEVWLQRVGEYEVVNPDEKFPLTQPKVQMQNGQLCMSYKLPLLSDSAIRVPIRPISDTEAIILGLGRTRGETLRAIEVNGEERLRYSGFEGRKRAGPKPSQPESAYKRNILE